MARSAQLLGVALILGFPAAARTELIKQVQGRAVFNIPRNTPVKDLLPIPPKSPVQRAGLPTDLTQVPEVFFQDPHALGLSPKQDRERVALERVAKDITRKSMDRLRRKFGDKLTDKELMAKLNEEAVEREKAEERIGYQLARMNFLNRQKTDHFLEVLCQHRPDLAGLPFVMGERCRLSKVEHSQFSAAVLLVRASLGPDQEDPRNFWDFHAKNRKQQKNSASAVGEGKEQQEPGAFHPPNDRFCVAALTQMLPVESAELQFSLVERLPDFDGTDAGRKAVTAALARLAVFSPEAAIRQAAVKKLKGRDLLPAREILRQGLRYPWLAVAENAAEALVALERKDLVPELVKMLDEADPRSPRWEEFAGKSKVPVVRELVRINHLRNCMLCHPPAISPNGVAKLMDVEKKLLRRSTRRNGDVDILDVREVFAAVPPPGHELPEPSEGGYGRSLREFQIRADVTYLRQDFSLVQHVAGADPWPEEQRFDFLVRRRMLSAEEANDLRAELARAESPYRRMALSALRRLTGRDAGETAAGWRAALGVK